MRTGLMGSRKGKSGLDNFSIMRAIFQNKFYNEFSDKYSGR